MNDITANPFASMVSAKQQQSTAVANTDQQRAVAEVQAAMMIARMNPRDPIAAVDRILNACTRPTLANAAVYNYSRGGSDISGPSIRLAEAMAQSWGNMQFGIRELDQSGGSSTVQAFAWDVETNTRREVTFQVPHVRHTRAGTKKLDDPRDVYEMVANQGSRRLRSCILAVIPGDVTEAAVAQCETTMHATADTSPDGVAKLLQAFSAYGVEKDHIEKRIQRRVDSIQPAQVVSLRKIYTSLKDKMSVAADWFDVAEDRVPTQTADRTATLKEKARQSRKTEAKVDTETCEVAGPDITITFAKVAEMIEKSNDQGALDLALDMIRLVEDELQRDELVGIGRRVAKAIGASESLASQA